MRVLNSGMFEVRVHLGVRYIWRDDPDPPSLVSLRQSSLARTCSISCDLSCDWYKLIGREQGVSSPPSPGSLLVKIPTYYDTGYLRRRTHFVNKSRATI